MRLVGYIRVSRLVGRDPDRETSAPVQRERIAMQAKLRGHEIVEWIEDYDQSGSRYERPGFQQALELVESGTVDGISAARISRFARSVTDGREGLRRLQAAGGALVLVAESLDTTTPVGRAMFTIMLAFAELELEQIREAMDDNRKRAVSRGVHIASRTPTGYLRRADGLLEPDPVAAPAIRELFLRRAAGHGWRALTDFLDATGISSPYGSKNWTGGAAANIVRNRVYLGEARSGKHVNTGAHEPIVTRAEWEAAQSVRALPARRTNQERLLAGVVRCGSCRYLMKADTMRDARGNKLGMYRCRRRHAAGICPAPVSILARVIEPLVEQQFLDRLRELQSAIAEPRESSRELDEALAELADAEAELDAYVASETVAIAGRAVYERGLAARADRVEAARGRVHTAQRVSRRAGRLTAGDLLEAWDGLTVSEQRDALTPAMDAVVVFPHRSGGPSAERVRVVWLGDAPADTPRRGLRVPLRGWDDHPGDLRVPPLQDA